MLILKILAKPKYFILALIVVLCVQCLGCSFLTSPPPAYDSITKITEENMPPRTRKVPYIVLNYNQPCFDNISKAKSFVKFSSLDSQGRCGTATACIGPDDLANATGEEPNETVFPAAWHDVEYDNLTNKTLYWRCYLISSRLIPKANVQENILTGTWYLRERSLIPLEQKVIDYIEQTGNHVLYRVTPFYEKGDLVSHGLEIEAASVEDKGAGLSIHVFSYNVQDGVDINYKNGDSKRHRHNKDNYYLSLLKKKL